MTVAAAQHDLRIAYFGGAPGMVASAAVWLTAGVVARMHSPGAAVLTLFAGGMVIHPLGVLMAKALGRSGAHAPGNPLGILAMESTALMIMALPLAYVVSLYRVDWFFPAMLLIIGGRYLTFHTMYGLRIYWACGASLAAASYALAVLRATPAQGALAGAAIEAAFAVAIILQLRRDGASAV